MTPVSIVAALAATASISFWTMASVTDATPPIVSLVDQARPPMVTALNLTLEPGQNVVESAFVRARSDCRWAESALSLKRDEFGREVRVGLGPATWRDDGDEGNALVRLQGVVEVPEVRPGEWQLCASISYRCGPVFAPVSKVNLACSPVYVR